MPNNQSYKKLKLDELQRISVDEFKMQEKIPVVVILDNIRSMHNVGSIFRTADSFNIQKIILCGITPQPPHREIHKTALGATESVDWEYVEKIETCIQELKAEKIEIIGIEQVTGSISLKDIEISNQKKYAIIVGNEVDGISDSALKLVDYCLEIPQDGTKHSLNVSVCAGIVLWEFYNQF